MSERRGIRIVLADDHALVLDGLRALAQAAGDMEIAGTASDGESALDAVRRLRPHVLVIDLQMPLRGGLSCVRVLRAEGIRVRIVVLSAFGDAHTLRTAIEEGADGFVLKTDSPHATLAAIRQVAAGQLVFPQAARRWLAPGGTSRALPNDPAALTDREDGVLALLADGRSNGEIAAALGVSESTVKFHLRNLYAKLGVTNRTEAAARYHRRG